MGRSQGRGGAGLSGAGPVFALPRGSADWVPGLDAHPPGDYVGPGGGVARVGSGRRRVAGDPGQVAWCQGPVSQASPGSRSLPRVLPRHHAECWVRVLVCARARVCVCLCAHPCVCVRVCMRLRTCACVRLQVLVCASVQVSVQVLGERTRWGPSSSQASLRV